MWKSIGIGILVLTLFSGCGNKDMAAIIMADIKANPPVKSVSVTKAGTTKTEYYDTSSIRMKLVGILMQNETLEWAKVLAPVAANVGTSLVNQYYQTKQNKDMWNGIQGIAGDRYSVSSGSNLFQGSTYSDILHAPAVTQ